MIDHISVTVSSLARATPFYDAVMAALGVPCVYRTAEALGYGMRNGPDEHGRSYLTVREGESVVPDRRHWAFAAASRAAVEAFHAAALGAGGRDDGAPGLRPAYHPAYYAAFVLDPDGNRLEAVCHRP